jgi:hypothetical protein
VLAQRWQLDRDRAEQIAKMRVEDAARLRLPRIEAADADQLDSSGR